MVAAARPRILLALGGCVALLIVGLAAWGRRAPEVASTAPVAPPLGPGGAGLPYKAIDGTIYTDKLFWGLLTLEDSPVPATPAQATEVLRVIGLLEAKLHKNQYFDTMLARTLRPDQLAFTEEHVAHLTADAMHAGFNPDRIHLINDELVRLSGQPAPTAEVEIPEDVGPLDRPLTVSRMTAFMLSYDALQADRALAIDAEEAARLVPWVDSYVRLKSLHQQTKRDILAVLTEPQKQWIDGHPQRSEEISDMTVLTARVKAAMQARVGGPPGAPG